MTPEYVDGEEQGMVGRGTYYVLFAVVVAMATALVLGAQVVVAA